VRKDVRRQVLETGTVSVSQASLETKMREAFEQIYATTGEAFAMMQLQDIKSSQPGLVTKEQLGNRWRDYMIGFVRTTCGEKIAKSTQTLYDDIIGITRAVIAEGATEGWGAVRVAREIWKRQSEIDTYRALRIARTEVVGASVRGSYAAAESLGVETMKIWVATSHGDRREGHWELNGVEIPMNETFTVIADNGDEDQMMHPHDPDASAANVINCRCAITYRTVNNYIDELLNN
jgi:hypothetical protein